MRVLVACEYSGVVRVELLGRVPYEYSYYRVRQPDGRIGIASDSMLRPV